MKTLLQTKWNQHYSQKHCNYSLRTMLVFIITLLLLSQSGIAQNVGIGTTTPQGELHVSRPYNWQGVTFTGSGVDDINVDHDNYTGTTERTYVIKVSNASNDPDLFDWSDDNGSSWHTYYQMSTSPVPLDYGISVSWSSANGHTDNDQWSFTIGPSYPDGLIVKLGQVGMGTDSPASCAKLEISGSDKGVLVPRTDTTTVNNANTGALATGLLLYQNSDNTFYYYDGSKWVAITKGQDVVFERNNTTVRQKGHYDTDDFIFGRNALPQNGESVTDSMFFFDKSKSAFRIGKLYNSHNWSPDNIGNYSFATGNNTKASGDYSTAWGWNTVANDRTSTAWGFSTLASNWQSTAWGDRTEASGHNSTAWGDSTTASGNFATVWGDSTIASGNTTTAWGSSTYARSAFETALGRYNIDYTPNSTTDWDSGDRLLVIGNGTSDTKRNNALTLYKNGDFILNRDSLPQNGVDVTDKMLFFDVSKAAFRTGYLYKSPNWATDSIGFGSLASGRNTKASGDYSTAMGDNTTASGLDATAMGDNTTASGSYSTAVGRSTTASGENSTAMGYNTTASGSRSTALGSHTTALSGYETVLGSYNKDYTPNSTTGWADNDRLFVIGNGTSSETRHNALTLYKNGDFILNRDVLPQNGESVDDNLLFFDKSKAAFRVGELFNSTDWSPDNIGFGSFASGSNTKASGDYSTAMGYYTTASGDYSTAMGGTASGDYSTAMGGTASGDYSTAMGASTTASGGYSTAMGYYTTANGGYSTAMGFNTTASGDYSTAMGLSTTASGYRSTAMGYHTTAPSYNETVLGSFNTDYSPGSTTGWNSNDRLFVIGNGTPSSNHNALTILKNGNTGINEENPASLLSVNGAGSSDKTLASYNSDATGTAVYGKASNSTGSNYGGYFKTESSTGTGVRGYADNANGENYGGKFEATGRLGRGVYGYASSTSSLYVHYGGYFEADGEKGYGVYGKASNSSGANFGGYFKTESSEGTAVKGYASNDSGTNYGGFFKAEGDTGKGVVGYGKAYDFDATGPGVNYGATSSIRWKKNIVEIPDPIKKIKRLRGVYFDWDAAHGGQHDVGCIAEEVGKVLPEIVVYEKNGIDADGMDYSKLTPLLIEAVKAQQTTIQKQQNEIQTLKDQNAEILKRLEALESK